MTSGALPAERELMRWVQAQLSSHRFEHSMGVVDAVDRLARRWVPDAVAKARVAAIVNDCAREYSSDALLRMTDDFGIVRNHIADAEPVLYHGPVAAALVQNEWSVHDRDVLQAIAFH